MGLRGLSIVRRRHVRTRFLYQVREAAVFNKSRNAERSHHACNEQQYHERDDRQTGLLFKCHLIC